MRKYEGYTSQKKNHPRDKSKKASFIHLVTGHSKLSKIIIKLARFNFASIALRPSASSRPTFFFRSCQSQCYTDQQNRRFVRYIIQESCAR